ncbi:Osteoclast-stimulating factor 1 [Balamuthia mandrillaris]
MQQAEAPSTSLNDALFQAAKAGYADDLAELSKTAVDVNQQDAALGNTALHYASAGGHLDAVKTLLAHPKIQVNATNKLGDTPLHKAVWKGSEEVVKALLAAGADVNILNKEEKRPVSLAKNSSIANLVQPVSTIAYDIPEDEEEEDEGSD